MSLREKQTTLFTNLLSGITFHSEKNGYCSSHYKRTTYYYHTLGNEKECRYRRTRMHVKEFRRDQQTCRNRRILLQRMQPPFTYVNQYFRIVYSDCTHCMFFFDKVCKNECFFTRRPQKFVGGLAPLFCSKRHCLISLMSTTMRSQTPLVSRIN